MSAAESSASKRVELLLAYLADPHASIPTLHPSGGTPYQQKVWQALQRIPVSEVRTYGELARELGSGARAVAQACRANPWPVLIPCHRVVSTTGLGGYMGKVDGPELEIKRWLLHHEGYV